MPLQLIHTFEGLLSDPPIEGAQVVLRGDHGAPPPEVVAARLEQRLAQIKAAGLDGLVVNVGYQGYLENPAAWDLLRRGIEAAVRLGLRLWIYDERGYPSGSAGGLTLRGHPEFEAQGIKHLQAPAQEGRAEVAFCERGPIVILRCEAIYDDGRTRTWGAAEASEREAWSAARRILWEEAGLQTLHVYYVAALYEGSHASRNYHEKRRTINLLDAAAVERFIALTHQRYAQELPPDLFAPVEAFFTDEPSFMSVLLPPLDEALDTPLPALDEPDPRVPLLPALPYSAAVEAELQASFGLHLPEVVADLFAASDEPSAHKCAYWEATARTYARAFGQQVAAACARLGKRLTGHVLAEESPLANVALHANPFGILKAFQLPGVDLLSNDLTRISVYGHKLPFSCAWLTGQPGIMSETSDFSEAYTGPKTPASKEAMTAALSMQFLLGVREYTYYYDFGTRPAEDYRWVNRIVQRTCTYGTGLTYTPQAALYVPYEALWATYRPAAAFLGELLAEQPAALQATQADLLRLCEELFRRNVQFVLCDASSLEQLTAQGVRQVLLPVCCVVAQELVEAARQGRLEVYGPRPDLAYQQGKVSPIGEFPLRPYDEFRAARLPFEVEEGLLIAALGRRYYCFNPTARRLNLNAERGTFVYDPFENSGKTLAQSKPLRVLPGRAVFVTVG